MTLLLSEIAALTGGQLCGADVAVSAFGIDSRTLQPGQVYVAIQGENFDGNDFIGTAEQAGAVAVVIRQDRIAQVPCVKVADTRLALAQIASAWRKKHAVQVVGVTGSNGKTTVKEMVAAILTVSGSTLFTQGNLNNAIGVPLTLLRLQDSHRYAVIEMGANHPGEIAYTSQYAQADVVVVNNAGGAHLAGFGSVDGVARAKGEIITTLKPQGVAVINRDDTFFEYWQSLAGNRKTVSFGLNGQAEVRATAVHAEIVAGKFQTVFTLLCPQGEIHVRLQLAGEHNVKNALAAATVALALGLSLDEIEEGLATVSAVNGRLQPLQGHLGNIVIDDTYNANPDSLRAGLDVLAYCPGKPWLVLGMFGEMGSDSASVHRSLASMIKSSGVQRVFAVGNDCCHTVDAFGQGASHYQNQHDLIGALKSEMTGEETILVKGSRSQQMEHVVAALVDNFRV